MDCIPVNLKNIDAFILIYMEDLLLTVDNHPCLFCDSDFTNKRLLLCKFEVQD